MNAEVVELADTVVLETTAIVHEGSTPSFGTHCSPVAQMAEAVVSKAVLCRFESDRGHQSCCGVV